MRETVDNILPADVACEPAGVLALQGVPERAWTDERMVGLAIEGIELFREVCAPVGLFEEVGKEEFARIFEGEGRNEPENPLLVVYPRAERLALFAVTVGDEVSARIDALFQANDFALGAMLDAAASNGAERCAQIVERRYREMNGVVTMRYSPGYCGWHVSGQARLFDRLRPGAIGMTLRDSFLMEPLKSISGVIVGGPGEIHAFKNDYTFCAECKGKECRPRIRQVLRDNR
ncbi:MAG: vitamin B12 dependent-methionine synthase activation domain-containing protein [Planctomycetota bacterium]